MNISFAGSLTNFYTTSDKDGNILFTNLTPNAGLPQFGSHGSYLYPTTLFLADCFQSALFFSARARFRRVLRNMWIIFVL